MESSIWLVIICLLVITNLFQLRKFCLYCLSPQSTDSNFVLTTKLKRTKGIPFQVFIYICMTFYYLTKLCSSSCHLNAKQISFGFSTPWDLYAVTIFLFSLSATLPNLGTPCCPAFLLSLFDMLLLSYTWLYHLSSLASAGDRQVTRHVSYSNEIQVCVGEWVKLY